MKMNARVITGLTALLVGMALTVSAEDKNEELSKQVKEALTQWKAKDSTVEKALEEAHGYAIFPKVAKGGFIVGGAGGSGEVYEKGKLIGRATLSQGTIGAQIGGQVFSELILFEDKIAMGRFKQSRFEMSAQATAVAATEGAAAKAEYANGTAILTMVQGGLMAEASVGGQKFKFMPLEKEE